MCYIHVTYKHISFSTEIKYSSTSLQLLLFMPLTKLILHLMLNSHATVSVMQQ